MPSAGGNGQGGGNGQRGGAPAAPSRPTPHLPDGRLNLGAPEGEKGIWAPAGIVQLSVNPTSVNRAGPTTHLPNNIKVEDVPFQEWARALHDYREKAFESDEPHSRCKPSGGARQFITPYGVEFVEMPEQKVMYIFDIGGPHTYRTIYMDGRQHPEIWNPVIMAIQSGTGRKMLWSSIRLVSTRNSGSIVRANRTRTNSTCIERFSRPRLQYSFNSK